MRFLAAWEQKRPDKLNELVKLNELNELNKWVASRPWKHLSAAQKRCEVLTLRAWPRCYFWCVSVTHPGNFTREHVLMMINQEVRQDCKHVSMRRHSIVDTVDSHSLTMFFLTKNWGPKASWRSTTHNFLLKSWASNTSTNKTILKRTLMGKVIRRMKSAWLLEDLPFLQGSWLLWDLWDSHIFIYFWEGQIMLTVFKC